MTAGPGRLPSDLALPPGVAPHEERAVRTARMFLRRGDLNRALRSLLIASGYPDPGRADR